MSSSLLLLLLLSAFFSASESALLSSSYAKIKASNNKIAIKLKEKEDEVLISIVIWNNIVNVLISILVGNYVTELFGSFSLGLATAIATFLLVTFGEILPKSIAVNLKESFILRIAPILYFFHIIISPISKVYLFIVRKITKGGSIRYTEEELKVILDMAYLKDFERKIVQRALELDSKTVADILIPKDDVVMISESESLGTALELMKKTKYSKLITYNGDKNNVTGYISLKDVIEHLNNLNKKVKEVKRSILFVPEYMKVLDLIDLFKRSRIPIAAVVDEYGNFLGIVTLTDTLEEVFGELREVGETVKQDIVVRGKEIIVDGDVTIDDLNTKYNLKLPKNESYNTIAGLILYHLKRIPRKGERININNCEIVIEDVDNKRIKKVRIIFKGK